jgi:hypothetical protein
VKSKEELHGIVRILGLPLTIFAAYLCNEGETVNIYGGRGQEWSRTKPNVKTHVALGRQLESFD